MAKQTQEELEQELLVAKAKLSDLQVSPEPKAKPYTKSEIESLNKDGHIIGVPGQKLSSGHNEEDLQSWDFWIVEIRLKNVGVLPEIGEKWSVPASLTPLKKEKANMRANDKVFQWHNKQIDFRFPASEHRFTLYLPTGTLEASRQYECSYWIEEVRTTGGEIQKIPRLLVKDCPKVTGGPMDQNRWGRG